MPNRTSRAQRRTAIVAVTLCSALGGACASAGVGSQPAPFPRAPGTLPAAMEPVATHAAPLRELREMAVSLQGTRYLFGGTSPQSGFDCSGLVRYVFARYHVDVPRTVAEQFGTGRAVAAARVSDGDLVFFSTTGPGATHVGIVVSAAEKTFVHAPGTGSVVRLDRFDAPYWNQRLVGVRRLSLPAPTSMNAPQGPSGG